MSQSVIERKKQKSHHEQTIYLDLVNKSRSSHLVVVVQFGSDRERIELDPQNAKNNLDLDLGLTSLLEKGKNENHPKRHPKTN